jgi:hypothetical protein
VKKTAARCRRPRQVEGTIEREEDALVRSGAVEMPIDGEKERSKNYPFI